MRDFSPYSASLLGLALFLGVSLNVPATQLPIDAANFRPDPAAAVTFHADGSATLAEDQLTGLTLLTNAPPLQPEVILATPGTILSFRYDFSIGPMDLDDSFSAMLLDSGLAIGGPFEFFTDSGGSGLVQFDLKSLVGSGPLGIEFALGSGDFEYGSMLLVSDLQLTSSVPAPAAPMLLVIGGLGLLLTRRSGNKALN